MLATVRRGCLARATTTLGVVAALVLLFWSTGCMERLFYYPEREPTPPPRQFEGAESVWFASDDGTRLHGWFVPASKGRVKQAATVLHVHGNAGSINDHFGFTDYLPGKGFNLFIFDYRGYGQSEGRARRRGPLIADTDAALDALLARPDVDVTRVGMYAQSLGGGIGLNVMAERPEIAAAVIESGFASWRDVAANALGGDPPGPIARFVAGLLIRDSHRPDEAIARIDRPVLLLHGTHDSIVPFSHSQRLVEAGPTARLVELEDGEHNTLRDSHPGVERMVVEFFKRELAPKREPVAAGSERP